MGYKIEALDKDGVVVKTWICTTRKEQIAKFEELKQLVRDGVYEEISTEF